ncbi:hypothetical protein [Geomicrobium sp. JCM 19055]|uniref:hypothetical protein n=1 Tax=Geomicrobium sp. JCM 19055 TaxID=1460649 RepID=UPI00045ED22B|nr:hypothetical protein [Geomicrobium sp. JCM 19055]GAK00909.1 hypothetical protein JCM19055_4033 [Geomicrobium sp. JCM 19055]
MGVFNSTYDSETGKYISPSLEVSPYDELHLNFSIGTPSDVIISNSADGIEWEEQDELRHVTLNDYVVVSNRDYLKAVTSHPFRLTVREVE